MRLFTRATITTSDIAAAFLLQEEMAEQAACANGNIDHDNIPDEKITPAKVALGAWNNVNRSRTATSVSLTGSATTATDTWSDVPKETTTDTLQVVIQTQDSGLQIETSGKYQNNSTANDTRIVFGIVVDGVREVLSPPQGRWAYRSNWSLSAFVPVGPGEHTVSVQWAFVDVLGTGAVGVAWERIFTERQLWVREVKR